MTSVAWVFAVLLLGYEIMWQENWRRARVVGTQYYCSSSGVGNTWKQLDTPQHTHCHFHKKTDPTHKHVSLHAAHIRGTYTVYAARTHAFIKEHVILSLTSFAMQSKRNSAGGTHMRAPCHTHLKLNITCGTMRAFKKIRGSQRAKEITREMY